MLKFRTVKNHAGFMLVGDYDSLDNLYDVVSAACRSPIVNDHNEAVLNGLCYDLRKAYEGKRHVIPPTDSYQRNGVTYGVEMLWPAILFQERVLQKTLEHRSNEPTKAKAAIHSLEAVIEGAIRADFPEHPARIIQLWRELNPIDDAACEKFGGRGAIFSNWQSAEREKYMVSLLSSFHPMYDTIYEYEKSIGSTAFISTAEFDSWTEVKWADPKW